MLSALLMLVLAAQTAPAPSFPTELVAWTPYAKNPVFEAAGPGAWDANIRERGWILHEDDGYHLWYTGYDSPKGQRKLGYATSPDGYTWTRFPGNPIHAEHWVEDMCVVKVGATYSMFAEGVNDHAELLESTDRIHWDFKGVLDIRKADGTPLSEGPFGTPAVFYEDSTWHLFYERDDIAVWLATSTDRLHWTNVQDEPVLQRGPEPYDRGMIAANQVIKDGGAYYLYYHATCPENGRDAWTMNIAASPDLHHWSKYPGNPIVPTNHSSGILVPDGSAFRFYTMHPRGEVFLPSRP